MKRHSLFVGSILVSISLLAGGAHAAERFRLDAQTYDALIRQASGHPNEVARWHGLWAYSNGRYAEARRQFTRAARYADKPAQYMLSMMSLEGEGAEKDPVAAYIWADLAAERGTSEELLAVREKLWNGLDEHQQAQVRERGPDYYVQYGDEVAMERTNREIGRFARNRTGTRTGSDSSRLALSFGAGTPSANKYCKTSGNTPDYKVEHSAFYGPQRIVLTDYWRSQDLALRQILVGNVQVGKLKRVRDTP